MLNIAEAAAETGIVSFGVSEFEVPAEEKPALKAAPADDDDDDDE